jgi:hypothetical protein
MSNKRKFNELLRVLHGIDNTAMFDINQWYTEEECGTVACAIGHAFSDTWFINRGAFLEVDTHYTTVKKMYPSYKCRSDYKAICFFFDITLEEAQYLFASKPHGSDNTLTAVKERIKDFMLKQSKHVSD